MEYIPADSLPTTNVTFSPVFIAPFRALFAEERNEERDARGRSIFSYSLHLIWVIVPRGSQWEELGW